MQNRNIYFIRHAEANYSLLENYPYSVSYKWYDLMPLSHKGVSQSYELALDSQLDSIDLIISSPYTRTLQTAMIIAKEKAIECRVDLRLHDWLPFKNPILAFSKEVLEEKVKEFENYEKYKILPKSRTWESPNEIVKRVEELMNEFQGFENIVLVTHELIIKLFINVPIISMASIHKLTI